MVKTSLTEEDKGKIIEDLNRDTEPAPDLIENLFPSLVGTVAGPSTPKRFS
jgi:hypothetical protein